MSSTTALLWIHALTPLRVGTDEGLGAINLPTLREAHTQHPIIPGSSLKGVLRASISDKRAQRELFGPEREDASDHRGALSLTDARLIALPVRSLHGTFAWCTSLPVLRRLNRDRGEARLPPMDLKGLDDKEVQVAKGSALMTASGKVFIEEFETAAQTRAAVDTLARLLAREIWPEDEDSQGFFVARFALLPEDAFNLLTRTSMEVRTRVSLDPATGTAAASGPWTEEAMPAETLLAALVVGRDVVAFGWEARNEVIERREIDRRAITGEGALLDYKQQRDKGRLLTFGGHGSVGLGRATARLVG